MEKCYKKVQSRLSFSLNFRYKTNPNKSFYVTGMDDVFDKILHQQIPFKCTGLSESPTDFTNTLPTVRTKRTHN